MTGLAHRFFDAPPPDGPSASDSGKVLAYRPEPQDNPSMRLCPTCGARYEAPAQYCQRDGASLRIEGEAQDPYLATKVLGQYRLEKVIGSGGMGVVYSGWDEGLGRRVAVKILHKDLVTNRDVVARFHREAQIAHQLDHPNIVRLIHFGQLPDGNLFLLLEFLEGPTLSNAIERDGPMNPARTVKIASGIAEAIGYAHRRDIVHRDLKPENIILINRDGDPDVPKVLDFGIAKMLIGGDTLITQAGLIFGTARYISPEGAQGDAVDKRSDVYSLGIITYQMLTGHTPFEHGEPVQLLLKHIHEPPVPMRMHGGQAAHVPPALEAVVMRALAKTPAARYTDGAAYARALREALVESDPQSAIRSVVPTAAMPTFVTPPPGTVLPPVAGARDDSGVRHNPAAAVGVSAHGSMAGRDAHATMFAGSMEAMPPEVAAAFVSGNHAPAPAMATAPRAAHVPATAAAFPATAELPSMPGALVPGVAVAAYPVAAAQAMPAVRPSQITGLASNGAGSGPRPVAHAAPYASVAAVASDAVSPANGYRGSNGASHAGSYVPPAPPGSTTTPIHPVDGEDEIVVPGLPSRRRAARNRASGSSGVGSTVRTVLASMLITILLGAGAGWALGMYPSQRREAEIRALIGRAEDALRAGHFAHDQRGNDVEDLTDAVLALSPGHARARQLRASAATRLRNSAVELRNGGQPAQGLPLLRSALRLAEDDTELNALIATFEREMAAPPAPPTTPGAAPTTPGTTATPGATATPAPPATPTRTPGRTPRRTPNNNEGDPPEVTNGPVPVQPVGQPTFTPGRDPSVPPPVHHTPPPVQHAPPPVIIQQQPPQPPPIEQTPPPIFQQPVETPPPYDPGGGTAF